LAVDANLEEHYMNKLPVSLVFLALCFGVAGCGDGTLEIKTKTAPASPIIVIEKPSESTTKQTKTETRAPDGSTTRTTETKTTTNP
jgi:hypothetical protein